MKKLGIIGGAGPLASSLFYETLVYKSYDLRSDLPEIILLNYPFQRGLTPAEAQENGVQIKEDLLYCLSKLKKSGADMALLICNTLHLELDKIKQDILPFVRIPYLVLQEIQKNQSKRLLLLGTQNTCRSSLYQTPGTTLFHLNAKEQKLIDAMIDRILEGKLCPKDSKDLEQIIRNFPERLDGVILGCTDLPVLHHHFPLSLDVPIYDSVKIPAQTILRFL